MKRSAVGTVGAVFAVAVVALGMPTSAFADDQILEPGMPCPAPVVDCGGGEPDPWEPLLTFEGHFYFVHPDFPGGQYVATERPDKDERCTWSRYDDAGLVESHSSYRDSHVVNLTVGDAAMSSTNCGVWTLVDPPQPTIPSSVGAGMVPNPAVVLPADSIETYNFSMNRGPRGVYVSSGRPDVKSVCQWETMTYPMGTKDNIVERHSVRQDRIVVDTTDEKIWYFRSSNCGTWTLLEPKQQELPSDNSSTSAGSLASLFGS